ncbi:MAG: hypothetical protein KDH19_10935 [Geminicoccaceae bacterium]|nr:hypothetical protein [Geminicoccaceae bacterium]
MPRFWRKRVLLVKPEATYGTDSAPTGAANAILARDMTFDVDATRLTRQLVKPTYGSMSEAIAKKHVKLDFEIELQGSGAAGTPPAFGPLLRACGFAETITAGTSVAYTPVTDDPESATAYFYADGELIKVLGMRSQVTFAFPPNDVPRMKFSALGLYAPEEAAALPPTDFSAFQQPEAMSNAATPTAQLHGLNAVMRSLDIDMGIDLVHRDYVGAEDVNITGRAVSGKISIEAVASTVKDWHAAVNGQTLAALSLVHGTAAGRIVEVAAPKVQVFHPRNEEEDGIHYHGLDLNFTETSGDDEISIIIR